MRRRSVLILTAVGLAAVGVGMAPWTLADDHATRQISKHVNTLTGLGLTVNGPVTLAVLPAPRIKLDDIVLSAPDGSRVLGARQLRGQLQLLPLLSGRFVLANATLVEPEAQSQTSLGQDHFPGADALLAAAAQQLTQLWRRANDRALHVERLTIIGGAFADGRTGEQLLGNVNLALNWPGPDATLALSGNAVYRGEAVAFSLTGLAPRAIANGGDTDLAIQVTGQPLRLEMRGALTDGGRRFDGKTTLSTPDLLRLDEWLNLRLPFTGPATVLTIDATNNVTSRGMALTSASVTLNGSVLEGALSFRRSDNGGVSLGGTLAADDLDLGAAPALSREVTTAMLAPGRWGAWDIDLRLSAARVRLPGDLDARDVAVSVLLRSGKLEAVLGSAEALGGRIKGRTGVTPAGPNGVDIRTQASFDGVSSGQVAALANSAGRITGPASGTLTLETRGATPAELRSRLEGRGNLQINEGDMPGVSFAELLRPDASTAPTTRKARGRSKFSSLRASWTFGARLFTVDDLQIQNALANVRLKGAMTLDGALQLAGTVEPTARVTGGSAAQTRLRVEGPWSAPDISVSAASPPPVLPPASPPTSGGDAAN